jgi:hypothetical protein
MPEAKPQPPLTLPNMSLVKALLPAAGAWTVRWCAQNWDLFLLRILPLAGVVSGGVEIAYHRAVVLNAFVLALCAALFLTLRQFPAAHQEAKSNLDAVGHARCAVGQFLRRLLG